MSDEQRGSGGKVGPFRLGASFGELGPGLGKLYEAWQADGFPVLLLMPGSAVDWQPERPWRVQLSFDPAWSAVALKVEQSPFPPDTTELANLLVLTTAAVTRVEDNPRVREHLAQPVAKLPEGPVQRSRKRPVPRWSVALASLAVLGVGVWLFFTKTAEAPSSRVDDQAVKLRTQERGTAMIAAEEPDTASGPYRIPEKPFPNQATPPCNTRRGEVAINDGCWVSLEQKPPCLDEQAQHKGRCYLPVARRERAPQSVEP